MTLADCIRRAVEAGEADMERADRAQAMWRELADAYERQGHRRGTAEALAADDVRSAFRKEAGDGRHVTLNQLQAIRALQAQVQDTPQLGTLPTDLLEHAPQNANRRASLIGQQRALTRRFHAELAAAITAHSRNLLGRVRKPALLSDVVRELHGESTGDLAAIAIAKAVQEAFKDMRRQFNEAGGVIGEIEDWGLPHSHNQAAIRRAGFEAWAAEIAPRLAWDRMQDPIFGRPLAEPGRVPGVETQRQVLREAFDNIAFGRSSAEDGGVRGEGMALWRRRAQPRVLPFRSASDWMAYNRRFGTGDAFASIIGHAHRMARDIALVRTFGPDPSAGFTSLKAMALAEARKRGDVEAARRIEGSHDHAARMLSLIRGSLVPAGPWQEAVAAFMSTTRHVLTAALLDRAILSAFTDANSMRMAAKMVGMNPDNVLSRHVRLLSSSLSRDEAKRAGWVADTLADPGNALARFQSEVPPAEFAERLSSLVMRVQGLSHWTDQARIAFQMEMAGLMAANAGKPLMEVQPELRRLLIDKHVTDAEWRAFTAPGTLFTAGNGATFASPIYWRQATDMPAEKADDLFARIQGMVEEQTEFAVPTQSVWARAHIEGGMPPGSIGYELAKSGLMFKSFPMTFTVNQVRRVLSIPSGQGRIAYAADLLMGATALGAVSLQILELASGNDPRDMTRPDFWAAAFLRGGGGGIFADAMAAANRPLGGLGDFAGGPVLGLAQDAYSLTATNMRQALEGTDPNLSAELLRMVNRYLPGGDLPIVGTAFDRMVSDRLLMLLDPDALNELRHASQRRQNLHGNGSWWVPGKALPSRAPDLGVALSGG